MLKYKYQTKEFGVKIHDYGRKTALCPMTIRYEVKLDRLFDLESFSMMFMSHTS